VRAETARIHEDERQRLFLLRQETLRQTEEFLQESHAGLLAEEALQAEISAGLAAVRVQKDRLTARRAAQATRGLRVLQLLTWILPRNERADWLLERRAFLYDLPAARDRIRWIIGDLCGLPRQAYALRTGTEKEPA
jgi:hypothetical protein